MKVPTDVTPIAQRPGSPDKHPGAEPLPGYRLLKLLGRGGFGEVWKCEAPGGLHKAIKFVPGGGEQFRQEFAAFAKIKAIRHPYLLTLERVELAGGELVMVMELADCQLNDRFRASRSRGLPGIARKELIGYLAEAAEALDTLSARHGLQHLDVKPENLFLVADHVKVGDYGLVRQSGYSPEGDDGQAGFTPRYAAPEILIGRIGNRCDQYSLALVYFELLTGSFPFAAQSARQLLLQHASAAPDLGALSLADRPIVGRALAKDPSRRFASSAEFVAALAAVADDCHLYQPNAQPKVEAGAKSASSGLGSGHPTLPNGGSASRLNRIGHTSAGESREATAQTRPLRLVPCANRLSSASIQHREVDPKEQTPAPKLRERLRGVVSADRLHGMPDHMARRATVTVSEFVAALVEAANSGERATTLQNKESGLAPPCRFLSTVPLSLIPLKLAVVAERWSLAVARSDSSGVVLRWEAKFDPRKSAWAESRNPLPRPRMGYDVTVRYPKNPQAEFSATAAFFGTPDAEVNRKAFEEVPGILEQIRGLLQNFQERRNHPRYPTNFAVRAYPIYSDGEISAPISCRCRDVSVGGAKIAAPTPIETARIFLEFPEIEQLAGHAISLAVIRTMPNPDGEGSIAMGRFPSEG